MKIAVTALQNKFYKDNIKFLESTTSTNDVAKNELLTDHSRMGIVAANVQTGGRGTHGRSFYSPASGVYFSIFLPILADKIEHPGRITANVAVMVADAIKEIFDIKVDLKWVNDIFYNGKKVGGILCETVTDNQQKLVGLVIGIGLNLATANFPDDLKDISGGLTDSSSEQQATKLIENIYENIKKRRSSLATDALNPRYADLMFLINKQVVIEQDQQTISGRVLGISNENELILSGNPPTTISYGRVVDWRV